ncbi:MAG TPA: aldehyde dehydrogenase family protein [Jatrophihabitantaceae bacterium]|nr:aldehyde dehydrogenase family protein [Jatrophihabitantaceae bacterium]
MAIALDYRIGDEVESGTAEALVDLNPSDHRQQVAEGRFMSEDQVRRAVIAADAAATRWRLTSPVARGSVLVQAAAELRADADRLSLIIALENGKTLAEARSEVLKSADFFEYFGLSGRLSTSELLPDARPDTVTRTVREPLGVVAAICPWNDPLLTPARKLAPALASGNAVLFKASEHTPLIARELIELLRRAGLPAGTCTQIACTHDVLRRQVLAAGAVRAVSFTGSTAVGRELRLRLATRNVRLQTEMGGKNAALVLADADLDLAASAIVKAAFGQAGQRCTATSRVVVVRSVAEELVARLAEGIGQLRVGSSIDPDTDMGPTVSAGHQRSVAEYVAEATTQGLTIRAGGSVPTAGDLRHGFYFEPTLILGADPTSTVWREEVFGPVLAVRAVDSVDDAIAVANDSEYGLAASVFTRSLAMSEQAIQRLDVGQVAINLPTTGWDIHIPFGGFGESGSYPKEQGSDAPSFYTRVKSASVHYG